MKFDSNKLRRKITAGKQINKLPQTASYFVETDLNLEMAQLRGGRFLMGTGWQEVEATYQNAKKHQSKSNEVDEESEEAAEAAD